MRNTYELVLLGSFLVLSPGLASAAPCMTDSDCLEGSSCVNAAVDAAAGAGGQATNTGSSGAGFCVPAEGYAEPCTSSADCAPELVCKAEADSDTTGTCLPEEVDAGGILDDPDDASSGGSVSTSSSTTSSSTTSSDSTATDGESTDPKPSNQAGGNSDSGGCSLSGTPLPASPGQLLAGLATLLLLRRRRG